jgi:uncharacterized membrane protein
MYTRRRPFRFAAIAGLVALVLFIALAPMVALAGPRSGGSFSGRSGFRSAPSSSMPRSYSGGRSSGPSYGGGTSFFFLPGWGYGGFGGGGIGLFGTIFVLAAVGIGAAMVIRAVRSHRRAMAEGDTWTDENGDEVAVAPGRAFFYKLQLALGRSARSVQDRLAEFAARGDTTSEAGLASLLQQSALELLRHKDSVRYAAADGRGPMTLTNAETAMNAVSLAERSRFQLERVRAADGRAVRSDAPAEEGKEALELVVVTLVVATRSKLEHFRPVASADELSALLSELGGVPANGLLGLEVIWTPADSNDSMTETDVMTTYPELRSL